MPFPDLGLCLDSTHHFPLKLENENRQALAELHRITHTIKGAAAMVGLNDLSGIGDVLERVMDHVLASSLVLDDELLEQVARFAKEKNAYLILDEIYHGLIYSDNEKQHTKTFAGRFTRNSNNVFIINSFSKYFCMTGWRIGWLIAPPNFVNDIDKLAQNIFLAASTPGQYAALASFSEESIQILETYRAEFQKRRDYLFEAVQSLGFQIQDKPAGAFYLYTNSSQLSDNSFRLAEDLLEKTGVAITPGKDFGVSGASSHVRFAYTTSLSQLEIGIEKLQKYFSKE